MNVFTNINNISENTKAETLIKKYNMTNKEFQEYLKLLKQDIIKYNKKPIKLTNLRKFKTYIGGYIENNKTEETNYTYYIRMIKEIIKNIKHGDIDYCFTIGQVKELLKYNFDLKIELCDFYFIVSL